MTARPPRADRAQDGGDGVIIRIDPAAGPPERLLFEPRDEGGWDRAEQVWTGCAWRTRGIDRVDRLAVETPDDDTSGGPVQGVAGP